MNDGPGDTSATAEGLRRSRNPRGEGERLRQEILEAMLRLLSDEARMRPLSLSLREVAREAGVSAPAIYAHFDGKRDLAEAAMDRLFSRLLEEIDVAVTSTAGEPPERQLAVLAHAYGRFAQANPSWFRFMFRDSVPHEKRAAELASRWREAVVRLADTGLRLTQTPEAAAMSVWSAIHGRLMLDGTASRVWQLGDVHEFIDVLTHSLVTAGPPPE